MDSGTDSRGYTIVEVLIFVAVSGFMFLVAALFISGKQNIAEFKQGMDDINTQVQAVVNDVANGNYPSDSDFICTPGSSGPTFAPGSAPQGTNQGCIFLGKVIQFGVSGTGSAGGGYTGYSIYTVAGCQYADCAASGNLSTSFDDADHANPTAALPQVVYNPGSSPPVDLTDKATLEWGLTATKMCIYNTGTGSCSQQVGAIGFFNTFGQYQTGDQLESGAQSVNVVILTNSTLGESESAMAASGGIIAQGVTDADVTANPDVVICFQGGSNQVGSLNIGNSGQRLTTDVELGGGVPGVCRS